MSLAVLCDKCTVEFPHRFGCLFKRCGCRDKLRAGVVLKEQLVCKQAGVEGKKKITTRSHAHTSFLLAKFTSCNYREEQDQHNRKINQGNVYGNGCNTTGKTQHTPLPPFVSSLFFRRGLEVLWLRAQPASLIQVHGTL